MDKLDNYTQIQVQIQTHTNTNAREETTKESFHAMEDWQTNLVGNFKPKELQELLSIIVIAIFIGEINEYLAKVLLMVINAILQAFIGPKRIRTFVTMMVMMII